MTRIEHRWIIATAVGWLAALMIYLIAGQISVVLLLGPLVYIAGDFAADSRKRRLQKVVDRTFGELIADEVPSASGFRGRDARQLLRRSRLVGLPPRLVDVRIVTMPDGIHYAVQAETTRARADAIQWQVTRLTADETKQILGAGHRMCTATQI